MRRRRATALAVSSALLLAGCGSSAAVSAADPRQTVAAGSLPVGISLGADTPVCTKAGDTQLCQIGVWYLNGTSSDASFDATTTDFKDGAGQRYSGVAGVGAQELVVPAQGKAKILWSVKLPYGAVPAEVRWAAVDGSVTSFAFGAGPSPSASQSVPQTGSLPPTATPEPASTTATPTATPTTATPSPKPTTATPRPKPTTATPRPRPSSTPTQPGGAIG